jgi:regulator of sirC expression with transglutaminase-like and TPR domain
MLGLVAYAWYVRKPNLSRWGLLCLCFAAGLMSKMMMVTFPFVLLLLDVWPLNRLTLDRPGFRQHAWPLLREKLPLFTLSILAVWLSSCALQSVHTLAPVGENMPDKLLRVPENYLFYIQKILWPAGLSVLHPIGQFRLMTSVLALTFLTGFSAFALRHRQNMPFLLVGWIWFLGTLVPVIGLVRFSDFAVADRYAYIPSIGLSLALVAGSEVWARRFPVHRWSAAVLIVAACMLVSSANLPIWRNSFTLYDAALRNGPHHLAYNNRGMAYLKSGDSQHAFEDFSSAIALNPGFGRAYSNRGSLLSDVGRYEDALQDFNHAIQCDPNLASAYNNRANARANIGDLTGALKDYDRSIQLSPKTPLFYNNRAAAYFRLGQNSTALADLKSCLALGGQPQPALARDLAKAIEMTPP